jgi:nitrate reductase NapAB chaperone NapD
LKNINIAKYDKNGEILCVVNSNNTVNLVNQAQETISTWIFSCKIVSIVASGMGGKFYLVMENK